MNHPDIPPDTLRPALASILIPFALGYYLSYLARVINAVLAPDLVADLALGAETLGLLTAAYFITFAAAQLPLGLLLDRYSARKIESLLLLVAAAGALLFALGESALTLLVGRALIGLGVSACLMAAFKTFTLWFRPEQLPLINGVILASGGLGALTATRPVQLALSFTDWRGVFWSLAALFLLSALVLYRFVPEHTDQPPVESLKRQWAGLTTILKDAFFWRIAPLTMLSQGGFIAIQSLWAGPWLQDVAGMSREQTADTLFLIALAMVTGFLGMGWLATRLDRVGVRPLWLSVAGMLAFQGVQWLIIQIPTTDNLIATWVAFGFVGTTGIIQYAVLSQHFPRALSGRVNTTINLFSFVSIFLLQSLMGWVIGHWPPLSPGRYPAAAYQAAFSGVLSLQVLAMVWFAVASPHIKRHLRALIK